MASQTGKRAADSVVETRYLVMPDQANPYGTAFGGTIMGWIDMVASMAAQRHCGREVVTAQIDSLSFKAPIHIGNHVVLRAGVNYVGRTSMEVGVEVAKEDPYTGERVVATTAYLTFVALDEAKQPTSVPGLALETAEERQRWENAKLRVAARKALREQIQASRE